MTSGHRFTSQEVCRLALVTMRQLQWWDDRGILCPERDGRRLYSPHEACIAMLYQELHERGLLLHAFRRVVKEIRRQRAVLPDKSRRWLLTDGARVVFLEHEDVVLRFLEQRRNPAFVLIPLVPLAARLAGMVLPERRGPVFETGEAHQAQSA